MRFAIVEAVVILAAASAAFAGDLAEDSYQRAETAVCDASAAVDGLDPRPWAPVYEQFRRAAESTLESAEDCLSDAAASLVESRRWFAEYERYTAAGDFLRASGAAQRYQSAWFRSIEQSREAQMRALGVQECVRSAWAAIGQ